MTRKPSLKRGVRYYLVPRREGVSSKEIDAFIIENVEANPRVTQAASSRLDILSAIEKVSFLSPEALADLDQPSPSDSKR
jgi:hypothetical protein